MVAAGLLVVNLARDLSETKDEDKTDPITGTTCKIRQFTLIGDKAHRARRKMTHLIRLLNVMTLMLTLLCPISMISHFKISLTEIFAESLIKSCGKFGPPIDSLSCKLATATFIGWSYLHDAVHVVIDWLIMGPELLTIWLFLGVIAVARLLTEILNCIIKARTESWDQVGS